jgi:hypothetical protein
MKVLLGKVLAGQPSIVDSPIFPTRALKAMS